MDQKDLNEPVGSATQAIVDTTTNDANKVEPTEVTKEVKTETDDVTVTETVTEAPAGDSGSSES